jgi:hypothetical protein
MLQNAQLRQQPRLERILAIGFPKYEWKTLRRGKGIKSRLAGFPGDGITRGEPFVGR